MVPASVLHWGGPTVGDIARVSACAHMRDHRARQKAKVRGKASLALFTTIFSEELTQGPMSTTFITSECSAASDLSNLSQGSPPEGSVTSKHHYPENQAPNA